MKKTILCFIIILLTAPAVVFGHTSLSDSNPQDGETVEVPIEAVELFFGGTIEEQSTFELVDEDGNPVPVDIMVEEDRMVGSLSETLSNGSYTVNWTVVGADGHPIEGSFSFDVTGLEEEGAAEEDTTEEPAAEETEAPELEETETESADESADESAGEEASESEQSNQQTSAATDGNQGMSPVLIGLLVVLGIIVILSGVWLVRRK